MVKNYLVIAWRNLIRYKEYSLINICGLSLAIAVFVLISEYIVLEKNVNMFHSNLPQMVRTLAHNTEGNSWPQVEPGWADIFKRDFPEVETFSRFTEGIGSGIVRNTEQNISLSETSMDYVEGNFFNFFTFKILAGSPSGLESPFTCFISKNAAEKYFGVSQDFGSIVGKSLGIYNQFGEHNYTVKGVFDDMGEDSDIRTDIALSLETFKNKANLGNNYWAALDQLDNQYIQLYLALSEGTDLSALEQKLTNKRRELQVEKDDIDFKLQAVSDIHLGKKGDGLHHTGSLSYFYILIAIACGILFIGWFNYINIYTSRAVKRSNEIGVRKAIGAQSSDILWLFLFESLVVNLISLGLGLAIAAAAQPYFNELVGKSLSLGQLLGMNFMVSLLLVLLVASGLSALAIGGILAGIKPAETLKGKMFKTGRGMYLRKGLVVLQFSISFLLIASTTVMFRQIDFMKSQNLGTDISRLVRIPAPKLGRNDDGFRSQRDAYFQELSDQSFMMDLCSSSSAPGMGYNFMTSGFSGPGSPPDTDKKSFAFAIVGHNYFNTYGIDFSGGRPFTDAETRVEWNDNDKVIMNESAIQLLGFSSAEEAMTSPVQWDERYLRVVGVVKDYHHESLMAKIKPMIFYPSASEDLTVKLAQGNMSDMVSKLQNIYDKYFPGNPFELVFLDETFNAQYFREEQRSSMVAAASSMAIFIACLGLFGLTLFNIELRLREIGVRKVLGASVSEIAVLISRQFVFLVLLGIVLAIPVAYYLLSEWMQNFAYSPGISIWLFIGAGVLAIVLSLLTVSMQSIKAALINPVKSLRNE